MATTYNIRQIWSIFFETQAMCDRAFHLIIFLKNLKILTISWFQMLTIAKVMLKKVCLKIFIPQREQRAQRRFTENAYAKKTSSVCSEGSVVKINNVEFYKNRGRVTITCLRDWIEFEIVSIFCSVSRINPLVAIFSH
jgi:hypothetical protein